MSEMQIRDDILEEEKQEQRPGYIIDTDAKAEWALRKIKEKKQELERWQEHYKMLAQQTTDQINEDIAFFSSLLERYFIWQRNANFTKSSKTQTSYTLPSGKLIMKHQEPEYKPNDEELVPWLKANRPEYVKVKESADWAGLKKTLVLNGTSMITEDGEIVPGIAVTPRPDTFKVEVK